MLRADLPVAVRVEWPVVVCERCDAKLALTRNKQPSLNEQMAWTFWQYTDAGRISGIKGPVDLNVYRGTFEEFEKLRR